MIAFASRPPTAASDPGLRVARRAPSIDRDRDAGAAPPHVPPLDLPRWRRSIDVAKGHSRFCESACAGHRRPRAFGDLTDSFSQAT
jgi:hypothetical protein